MPNLVGHFHRQCPWGGKNSFTHMDFQCSCVDDLCYRRSSTSDEVYRSWRSGTHVLKTRYNALPPMATDNVEVDCLLSVLRVVPTDSNKIAKPGKTYRSKMRGRDKTCWVIDIDSSRLLCFIVHGKCITSQHPRKCSQSIYLRILVVPWMPVLIVVKG